jgi:hypothetical protein
MLVVPRHGITNFQLSSITDGSNEYSLRTRFSGVEDMLIPMRPLQLLAFTVLLTSLAITAPAEAQIRIHGTLLGADGQPMTEAHVIVQDWPVDTSIVATADERGRFSLTLPEPGDYGMYLTGVHHKPLKVPLILTETKPVKLRVRLGTYNVESTLNSAKVKTIPHEYWDMQNENGTFVISQPVEEDTLAYKIVGTWPDSFGQSRFTVSGSKADRYKLDKRGPIWDTTGDYLSILKDVGTAAEVTFHPDDLPAPGREATVESETPTVEAPLISIRKRRE